MAKMGLGVSVGPHNEHVRIELVEETDAGLKNHGHIELAGSDAEDHIQQVANARAQLGDPVPDTVDPGSRIAFVKDPICKVGRRHDQGRSVPLVIRHPGIGWLSLLLSPEDAARSGEQLIKGSKGA